jgi:hypothetical protein
MKVFFKVFLLLIGIVLLGGLVLYFMASGSAKEIDVEWTPEDFSSYNEKIGNDFGKNHASVEDIFAMNIVSSGQMAVDDSVTDSELTAIANMSVNQNSVVHDVKINCLGNDEIEMSAIIGDLSPLIAQFPFLEKYETALNLLNNKEIYIYSTLYYDETTGLFGGTTKELYVGNIKMPVGRANDTLRPGGSAINGALQNLEGFSVNSFEVTEEGFDFDGTIPEKVKSAGSFEDLSDQLGN